MNLQAVLPWCKNPRPPCAAVRRDDQAGEPGRTGEAVEALQERQFGCGWFESSHELQHGLQVQEHSSADSVAADLPLADWLALHMSPSTLLC